MTSRYTLGATQDVDEAVIFYERRGPGLSDGFREALNRCIDQIEEHPRLYPRVERAPAGREIRQHSLDRYPFSVVYEIEGEEPILLAVAHHGRRPNYWKKRRG